jgi:hypothetical protein
VVVEGGQLPTEIYHRPLSKLRQSHCGIVRFKGTHKLHIISHLFNGYISIDILFLLLVFSLCQDINLKPPTQSVELSILIIIE